MPHRLLSVPLILVALLFSLTLPVFAQAPPTPTPTDRLWFNPSTQQFQNKIAGEANNLFFAERYSYAQLLWVINSFALIIRDNLHPSSLEAIADFLSFSSPPQTLADLLIGSTVWIVSHPPASGLQETGRFLAKFDLASPALAQGYGYTQSTALLPLWAAMRDSAYLLTVLILLAAGFMIIFRVKISPRASLSLTSLIPRTIITLLGINFSFAIAGFAIDLVYLTVASVVTLLAPPGIVTYVPAAINFFATPGYFEKLLAYYLAPYIAVLAGAILLATIIPLAGVISILLLIIMVLVTLILLFRVWWMLLKTYINLLFIIIFAPWQILLGLLPGSPGFTGWLRNLIAHCAVFAIVPLLFLAQIAFWRFPVRLPIPIIGDIIAFLGGLIGNIYSQLFAGVSQVGGTFGGFPSFPLFAGQGTFFDLVVSWVFLALIPKAADMIKNALKVSPFKYGTAFSETLSPISKPVGSSLVDRGETNLTATGWGSVITGGIQSTVGQAVQGK